MLVQTRKLRQRMYFVHPDGTLTWVEVLKADRGKASLGFTAPKCVAILREEMLSDAQKAQAAEMEGEGK